MKKHNIKPTAITIAMVLLLMVNYLQATVPNKQFDLRFGGSADEELRQLKQTADGGFIYGGYSLSGASGDKSQESQGVADYWIVKTDAYESKLWDARFGGSGNDYLMDVVVLYDGYLLAGHSYSGISGDKTQGTQETQGNPDYWVVRVDAFGVKKWDARFGGSGTEVLTCAIQTTDGAYVLGGYSDSGAGGDKSQSSKGGRDYWIVKIDTFGVKQWDKTFGGSDGDEMKRILETTTSDLILAGDSYSGPGINSDKSQASQGLRDYWIIKTNSSGDKIWDQCFGGPDEDILWSINATSDGYFLGGYSYSGMGGDKSQSSQGEYDYWVVKIDVSGTKQWDKRFGGSGSEIMFVSLVNTNQKFILAGYSNSGISGDKSEATQGGNDYWIVCIDASGNKEWDKDFGGSADDNLFAILQTIVGEYKLAGKSLSEDNGDKSQASQGGADYWMLQTTSDCIIHDFFGDADGDGFGNENVGVLACVAPVGYVNNPVDCDDTNPFVNPVAPEVCNGLDDNCGGDIDEEVQLTFYADADVDGYGNAMETTQSCSPPSGYVSDNNDCNDADASIHPNSLEICNNSIDDNCNGQADESCTCNGGELIVNGDFSSGNTGFTSDYIYCNSSLCMIPATTYAIGTDPAFFHYSFYGSDHTTGAGNLLIVNGSGTPNANVWCQTIAIQPGIDYTFSYWLATVNFPSLALLQVYINGIAAGGTFTAPSSLYTWNQFSVVWNSGENTSVQICIVDQNLDLSGNDFALDDISFNCTGCIGVTVYKDEDLDNYGDPDFSLFVEDCSIPNGYSSNNTDCNDTNASIYPGAVEVCSNGTDDNCNGQVDEGGACVVIAVSSVSSPLCLGAAVSVGFEASGVFNNGNHFTAELSDASGSFADPVFIGELYSVTSGTIEGSIIDLISTGTSYRIRVTSSDPPAISPDNGSDLTINTYLAFYADVDKDGFGDINSLLYGCGVPEGYVINSDDCNDLDENINPSAVEICNGIDDNCNSLVDEGCTNSCDLPFSLFVNNITSNAAHLNWTEVSDAKGYKIRYKIAGPGNWTKIYSLTNFRKIQGLASNTEYKWQLETMCASGPRITSEWSAEQTFTTAPLKLGAWQDETIFDVYPNPFTSSASISFSLQHDAGVQIELYDVAGRKLQTVLDENTAAGNHVLDLNRDQLNAGIYFLGLRVNENEVMKKLIIQ